MKLVKSFFAILVTVLLVGSAVYYKYDDVTTTSVAEASEQETVTLTIAYLPITHALPLFEAAELLEEQNSNVQIELVKYGSWSDLMDALNSGRVDGASVLIEMAMKSKEQGINLTLSLLGHRDGNVIITSNDIETGDQLAGKTFAIPNTQSSHNILLQLLLEEYGLTLDDIEVVELAPAEMPAALQSGQIDGYCVAEPFGAKAVDAGIGKVFATSDELWDDSICCGIVFNADAIADKLDAVEVFEEIYEEAGELLTEEESERIAIEYLDQEESIVDLSLQWISFTDLEVTESAYESLTEKIISFGLSDSPPDYESFVMD